MATTTQHFVYVCTTRQESRKYGGSTYTLAVYENRGKGEIRHVASCEACTRAHMGEPSEALTALIEANAIRPAILKRVRAIDDRGYYLVRMARECGLTIQLLGGA